MLWPTARNVGAWAPEKRNIHGDTMPAKRYFAQKHCGQNGGDLFRGERREETPVELHLIPTGLDVLPQRHRRNSARLITSQLAQFTELGALAGKRPSTLVKSRFDGNEVGQD